MYLVCFSCFAAQIKLCSILIKWITTNSYTASMPHYFFFLFNLRMCEKKQLE